MDRILHWLMSNASVFSVLVTVSITIFLICCLKCTECSRRDADKDDLFRRHSL